MLPSLKLSGIHGSKWVMTRGFTDGCVARKKFRPSAHACISVFSHGCARSYFAFKSSASLISR
jgi:hypothetical protein